MGNFLTQALARGARRGYIRTLYERRRHAFLHPIFFKEFPMRIEQIRNATLRVTFAGTTFLIDPWLAGKGSMGCFADTPFQVCHPEQKTIPMPIHDLPMTREEVLKGVNACIITHVHPDHIDMAQDGTVGAYLPKDMPCLVQSSEDAEVLARSGFARVDVLGSSSSFAGIALTRTPGCHGTIVPCGPSCGVLFSHPEEKTLYVAGDTIWYEGVADTLQRFAPDVIVLNACAAELVGFGRLIMDDQDVAMVRKACPEAEIVISHMDNVAHASITRAGMKERLNRLGLHEKMHMPEDGEVCTF